jgi:hypothetical protein
MKTREQELMRPPQSALKKTEHYPAPDPDWSIGQPPAPSVQHSGSATDAPTDLVDEISMGSFPCSDPMGYGHA